jgi:hypothetical protein
LQIEGWAVVWGDARALQAEARQKDGRSADEMYLLSALRHGTITSYVFVSLYIDGITALGRGGYFLKA